MRRYIEAALTEIRIVIIIQYLSLQTKSTISPRLFSCLRGILRLGFAMLGLFITVMLSYRPIIPINAMIVVMEESTTLHMLTAVVAVATRVALGKTYITSFCCK